MIIVNLSIKDFLKILVNKDKVNLKKFKVSKKFKVLKRQYGGQIPPTTPVKKDKNKKRMVTPTLTRLTQNELYNPKLNRSFSVKREFNQSKSKYLLFLFRNSFHRFFIFISSLFGYYKWFP